MKRSRFIIRLTALLLVLLLPAISLVSCRLDDEEAFVSTARDMIVRSAALNEIYFGSGIPYVKDAGGIGNYYRADEDYLAEAGFETIDQLRALTAEVFSEEY